MTVTPHRVVGAPVPHARKAPSAGPGTELGGSTGEQGRGAGSQGRRGASWALGRPHRLGSCGPGASEGELGLSGAALPIGSKTRALAFQSWSHLTVAGLSGCG